MAIRDGRTWSRLGLLVALTVLVLAFALVSSAQAATLVLRPTNLDATRATVWTTLPTAGAWQSSLAADDADSSYAHGVNSATNNQNVFLLLDQTTRTTGIINSVKVTARVRPGNAFTGGTMRLGIAGATGAATYDGPAWTVPNSATYVTREFTPATDPAGGAWDWGDFNTLRAVVEQTTRAGNGGDRSLRGRRST